MKKTILTLCLFCAAFIVAAQCNSFFPLKENVKYEYDHFDKKDKLSLRTTQSFKDIAGSGTNMKAKMVQEVIDVKKDKIISTAETDWNCEDGTLHFTMNSMTMGMDNGQQANMGAGGMTVDVTGDKMDLPSALQVGQTLKDINYNIKMTMSGVTIMNRDLAVTDRKVEAQESITTPAGTFDCYKVNFTTTSTGGIGSGTIKTTIWYAKDVGLVKSENYKDDGKVLGKQILHKVSK